LYGCEIWSLILKEAHKLKVFQNNILTRIFGPKRDGIEGGWRNLHNEELHKLYCSPNIVRMSKAKAMRWTGHVGIFLSR
jgi:hypothetical protein